VLLPGNMKLPADDSCQFSKTINSATVTTVGWFRLRTT